MLSVFRMINHKTAFVNTSPFLRCILTSAANHVELNLGGSRRNEALHANNRHEALRFYCANPANVVRMKGLNLDATEEDVLHFFKPLGITPTKIRLRCDISGRVSGLCEVEFATHAEAVVAMRKKNAFIGSRFIRLSYKQLEGGGGADNHGDTSPAKDIPDVVVARKEKRQPTGDIDRTSFTTGHFVNIKNLSPRSTEQLIYNIFSPLNITPTSIKPVYDEYGCRTGEFDVEFLSHEDAVKAMAKDKLLVGRKTISLTLKSDTKPVPRFELPDNANVYPPKKARI